MSTPDSTRTLQVPREKGGEALHGWVGKEKVPNRKEKTSKVCFQSIIKSPNLKAPYAEERKRQKSFRRVKKKRIAKREMGKRTKG